MVRKTRTLIPSSGREGSGSQNPGSGRRDGVQSSTASQEHGGIHPAAPQQHGGAQYSQVPRQQGGAGRGWGPGNPQQLGRRGGVSTSDGAYAPVGPSTPPVPELHQAIQPPHQAASASLAEASSSSPDVALAEHVGKLSLQAEPAAIQAMVPASSKSMRFPLRPSKGCCGTKCLVKANHFFVELLKKDLHQYYVSITPEVTSRGVNRAVMKELVRVFTESHLGGRLSAYDGRKSLYTAGHLPFTFDEFQVTLVDDGPERRPRNFRVVIKLAARVDLHHLRLFLTGKQAVAPQEALQVLAIVLRELATPRYSPVGRCFYSPNLGQRQPLGEGIESWRGFYQSIRPTQMGLSLIIDMSTTVFIEPLKVVDFVNQLLNRENRDVQSQPLSYSDCVKIMEVLRGIKVEVTHRGNMRRKYRISGLTSLATRELIFPIDEGGTMKSMVQYFHEKYGYTIQHTNLRCLQVGNQKRPNYLPMEARANEPAASTRRKGKVKSQKTI